MMESGGGVSAAAFFVLTRNTASRGIPGTERKMEMRSDKVTKGIERAPMRSLFYAMGYTKEELERPLIGVVSAKSEIVPGHMHLDQGS